MIGQTIAHYRVTEKLGAGGMGEVYRATDTKLNRDVALKVLPEEFAKDSDRMARFKREAQVLASLNHGNIAAIHGLEQEGDTHALALELVEGSTLADRIRQGAIPLEEALSIARQTAEALEAAHEHGIIHRDLKPANIKVKEDGTVKVLDFGLAKALEDPGTESNIANSPTLSVAATKAGVVLGTAAYMSPEQARGHKADRRADIWSFGVVLFEMLTGKQAFEGETVSDVLAAVLRAEIEWVSLPAQTPAPIRRLLQRCLTKERRRRLGAVSEALFAIEEYQADPTSAEGISASGETRTRSQPWWVLPAVATAAAVVAAVLGWQLRPVPESPLRKFDVPVKDLWMEETRVPKLTADGSKLLYVKTGLIWVRELDDLVPRELLGTDGAWLPVWSPRGDEIAFVRGGSLWKTSPGGGQPGPIAALPTDPCNAGMVWGEDDRIYYSPGCAGRGLFSVSAQGGDFEEILPVQENESDYHEISMLPDGRGLVLVLDTRAGSTDTLVVFDGAERKTILQAEDAEFANPMYSSTGHLLYERRGNTPGLWAAPFSLSGLEITGEPFLVAPGAARSSLSADGTLAYLSSVAIVKAQITWVNRDGEAVEQMGEGLARARYMRLSPDGKLAAVSAIPEKGDDDEEIFLVDLARGTQTRLTFSDTSVQRLSWDSSGDTIYYESGLAIFTKAANGTGDAKEIVRPGRLPDVSRDGKTLVFARMGETSGYDLWYLPLEDGEKPAPFVEDPGIQAYPAISPDGRFVAYHSYENGRPQVFVKSFPGGEGKWQVSAGEGHKPRWNRRGDRLYYAVDHSTMMEVEVETRPAFRLGQPRELFRSRGFYGSLSWRGFDVAGNGERFLVAGTTSARERTATITVVQNWFAEFRDKN